MAESLETGENVKARGCALLEVVAGRIWHSLPRTRGSPSAVALFDTNGVWRLDGGVQFTFTNQTTLAAGARLLVVNFNPADAAALPGDPEGVLAHFTPA